MGFYTDMPSRGSEGPITSGREYFSQLTRVVQSLATDEVDRISRAILQAYREERTVFLFGNGGSASLASHFACDLGKGTAPPGGARKRLRALALTDNVPLLTAWANDTAYEEIFAEQLRNFIGPGDISIAISGSGNSPNVLKALQVSHLSGALNIGLTGFAGGKLKPLCDLCLVVPSDNMQLIEDVHLSVAHSIFTIVRHHIMAAPRVRVAAGNGKRFVISGPDSD